jgi:hypothetical protein
MTKCFRPVTNPDLDPDIGSCTLFCLDLARESKDYVNQHGKFSLIDSIFSTDLAGRLTIASRLIPCSNFPPS